jgi:hypothetical protein
MRFDHTLIRVGLYGVLVRSICLYPYEMYSNNSGFGTRFSFRLFCSACPSLDWILPTIMEASTASREITAVGLTCPCLTLLFCLLSRPHRCRATRNHALHLPLECIHVCSIEYHAAFSIWHWPFIASFSLFSIFKRFEHPYLAIFAAEIAGLALLWIFWLAGAAGSSVRPCCRQQSLI